MFYKSEFSLIFFFLKDIDNSWPPNKIMRLDNGDCDSSGTGINGILLKALVALFRRIAVVASRHETLCRETHFVLRLLEQLVMCGRGSSQIILRHLPPTLVRNCKFFNMFYINYNLYILFLVAKFDTLRSRIIYCRFDFESI